ncbi:MAG: hypothetical protein NW216_00875 [Hyphomicrobium sp.]|nr:hypothetical protein [Hyphomicrobium sp.]
MPDLPSRVPRGIALVILAVAATVPLMACTGNPFAPAAGPLPLVTEEERAFDCDRINGRMQVRILAMRGAEHKSGASDFSNSTRTVLGNVPGNAAASGAEARTGAERAKLDALNALLAEKGCPTYDLEKELAQRPSAAPPEPRTSAAGANAKP